MRFLPSILICSLGLASPLAAAVYDVGANTTFASFSAAFAQIDLDAASIPATTTITVHARSGNYVETLQPPLISQPLHVMGLYGQDPVILSGSSYGIRVSGLAHVTLERLIVRNSGSAGISLEYCPGARLLWNRLQNNGGVEIQVTRSPGSEIRDNDLRPATGSGLVLQFSPGSSALSNRVSRGGPGSYSTGLAVSDSPGSLLLRNRVQDALTSFGVYSSQGSTLSAGVGIARNGMAGSQGAYFSNSPGCVIRNNLLVGQPRGLEIQSSPSCAVQNNTLWEHGTVGLVATLSGGLLLRNNLIHGYTALDFDSTSQGSLSSDYNLLSGDNRVAVGISTYTLLSNWQSTGNDPNSLSTSDPFFRNPAGSEPEDFQIGGGSPARESGTDLSSQFTHDHFDNEQNAPWDMGFHADSGVLATSTPSLTPSPVVPTATVTPTLTATISQTFTPTPPSTATPSATVSPTFSITPTFSATPPAIRKDKLTSYPNPYEPSKGPLNLTYDPTEEAGIKIYDIAGTLVAEVPAASIRAGEGYASWDGKDASSRALPSGLYFAVLRSARGNKFTRFTVLHR